MSIEYQRAALEQLDLLVATRVEVLRAANNLSADADMRSVEAKSRAYYAEALADGSHTGYLAFDGDRVVGAGGVSYYRVMPTYHNPTGRKAYIMNLYVAPDHRRRGIATALLDLLMADIRRRGVKSVSLEATAMGRPLYEKYGFVAMEHEMEWP